MKLSKIFFTMVILFILNGINASEWKSSKSKNFLRITDCIIQDIDNDGIDEVITSSYSNTGKYIEVFKYTKNKIVQIDRVHVPYYTVFFDVGDIDNDGKQDIVCLSSDGVYYRNITKSLSSKPIKFKVIRSVTSQLIVPQPELLLSVKLVMDMDGDNINELVIQNVREVQIYETKHFTKIAAVSLKTFLEFGLIPGQFYPHYIFYTFPMIYISDMDNDKKLEIITKFPRSVNIYAQVGNLKHWTLKRVINIGEDNVYFLSNSFVKFSFPVITDLDNDNINEVMISSANLDLPHIRFEAIGDLYYFDKGSFKFNKNKKIKIKGIPLNMPVFYNISNSKYRDMILPVVPFNLVSLFGLLSGNGVIKIPFMYYKQTKDKFDMKHPKKLFELPFHIENMTSFIEELPFDQAEPGKFPDFFYFTSDHKKKKVNILRYHWVEKKYVIDVLEELSPPSNIYGLPSTLKLGNFSNEIGKEVLFYTYKNFYIVSK